VTLSLLLVFIILIEPHPKETPLAAPFLDPVRVTLLLHHDLVQLDHGALTRVPVILIAITHRSSPFSQNSQLSLTLKLTPTETGDSEATLLGTP
jgi:hypothetical protein